MLEYLKKNWLGFLGLAVGLIGIFLSYYFYSVSLKSREPAFLITKDVPLFSSPKGLSSEYLKLVTKSDGKELIKNLYLQEFTIWNNGKETIKREDVLKPITLSFSDEVEIVDAFVSEMNRPKIVKANVSFHPGGNVVSIDFAILEYNDGMKIQVVYAAKESSPAHVDGVIEGVVKINNIDELSKERIAGSIAKMILWGVIFIVGAAVFVSIGEITKWICEKLFRSRGEKVYSFLEASFAVSFILFIVVAGGAFLYGAIFNIAEESVMNSVPAMEKIDITNKASGAP